MGLKEDLSSEVGQIFREAWDARDGIVVPEAESLRLANDAVRLTGTVLYADLAASTTMVIQKKVEFSAEVYKAFLHCAAKIVRAEGGDITAYDGDRIMAVYVGGSMRTAAVRTALKLKYAVSSIVQPALKGIYKQSTFELRYCAGIDTSDLFVARTGIRGNNDLVWVGRAANYAAKLSGLRDWPYATYITEAVHSTMHDSVKKPPEMWERRKWDDVMPGLSLYRTSYHWAF